jgi:hypothetical protein
VSYRITIDGQPFEVSDKDSAAKLLKDARELAFRNPHLPVPKIGYSSRDIRPLATQTQRDIKAAQALEDEQLLLLM